jgi:hypothetical protein
MRLHVCIVGAEQLPRAADSQALGNIDKLAATVVALAGIAFGVFVGQDRTLSLQDPRTGVVLRGDQLDVFFLAAGFVDQGIEHIRVEFLDGRSLGKHANDTPGRVKSWGLYLSTG